VWVTGRMEQELLKSVVPVEWNKEFFSVVYLLNGIRSSSVWGTGRIAGEIL